MTRDSENERQRVDQIALLDMALRFNPDIIVVGEMRGPEANAAQEAARTGVAVVTTTTLTKTSIPKGAIRRCEIQGRNDTGENWRTDTDMIPKHDNLIGG